MTNTTLETQQEIIPTRKKTNRNTRNKLGLTISLVILSIGLWGGLLYGGYWLANGYIAESKAYIDAKVEQIEKQNQEQMNTFKELQTELDQVYAELLDVKGELVFIQEDLALTGETLSGTDKTKQTLQKRIDELNKQLNTLRASIQKLEDAARN